MTRELIALTNTTVVNSETISELLRKIAALGLTGPIVLVLDTARYRHHVEAISTTSSDTRLLATALHKSRTCSRFQAYSTWSVNCTSGRKWPLSRRLLAHPDSIGGLGGLGLVVRGPLRPFAAANGGSATTTASLPVLATLDSPSCLRRVSRSWRCPYGSDVDPNPPYDEPTP